jgi:hypothetical protein
MGCRSGFVVAMVVDMADVKYHSGNVVECQKHYAAGGIARFVDSKTHSGKLGADVVVLTACSPGTQVVKRQNIMLELDEDGCEDLPGV